MVDAVQIAKERAEAVVAPPQTAVSVAKLKSDAVVAPPQTAVSDAKMRAEAVMAPPQTAVSVAKWRVYAIITTKVVLVPDYMWPQSILVPQKAKLSLMPFNTTGGQGFTNVEQVIGNTPGRLKLDLSNIRVKTDEHRLAWETLEFQLQGRAKTVGMPLFRWMEAGVPWPTIAGILTTSAPGYASPVILAYAHALVLPGAVTLQIRMEQGGVLKAAHVFEFEYKVYFITEIISGTTVGSPPIPVYTVKIWPPIRERIEQDEQFEFDNPIMRCRLSEDNAMAVEGGWEKWKRGNPSLTFYEDVTSEP